MKVLWFANTPCNSDGYFNKELKGSGGWLKALDINLQKFIDLHIAFDNGFTKMEPFIYGKSKYYPIKIYKSKIQKYYKILRNEVYDAELLEQYLKIINMVNPDIIHIHGTENSYACIINHVNIPVVVSIQGIVTTIIHKYFFGIEKQFLSFRRRKGLFIVESFSHNYFKMMKMAKIEQKNLQMTQYIFGQTDWDRRTTKIMAPQSLYFKVDRILRDAFYQKEWQNKKEKKCLIITTSGNKYYKGFENVCLTLKILSDRNFNCEWSVIGVEESDLIVEICKKKLKNSYPSEGLNLLGSKSEQEIVENLINSNLYVMPSNIENESNALYEAMILGLPCISTFVGGTNTTITDETNGLLVPAGDPFALAGTIIELYNDPGKTIRLSKQARLDGLRRNDPQTVINSIIKNYEQIINHYHLKDNSIT